MDKDLFKDINTHLLEDTKPSIYLKSILNDLKNTPLKILTKLEKIEQSPVHHPEGNVLNHTLLVVDSAALVRESAIDKEVLMWSALLHDIGKIRATRLKNGRIVAYNHDTYGKEEAEKILNSTKFFNETTKQNIIHFVSFHMHSLYISKRLPFGNLSKLMDTVDLNQIILLFFSDRLGRGDFSKEAILDVFSEIDLILDTISEKYNIDATFKFWSNAKANLLSKY
ncbi:HDIG domain-containing metalloprotein [uncultured Clostridium sp.]|uniref:HDIG domain-containing metalloprotein n=1 Tax=uncultured Clostridium sp. TaxID=59620 RepID=UPI002633A89C|nr:HDIG domain-containing metalloprotein [uncultured Clostridium sp.]